jgi:monovalent cation:H+ antiporter-2, CPA2 family
LFKTVSFFLTAIWLLNLIPFSWLNLWFLSGIITTGIVVLMTGWRLLVRWHIQAEIALADVLKEADTSPAGPVLKAAGLRWGLSLEEFVLPENSPHAGKSIGGLQLRSQCGASIVGIDRQGFHLSDVGPNSYLFPADKLYLLGEPAALQNADSFLGQVSTTHTESFDLAGAVLDETEVLPDSPWIGKSLTQLRWPRLFGTQVVAVNRNEQRLVCPTGNWIIKSGDRLLLAGPRSAIEEHIASQKYKPTTDEGPEMSRPR